MLRGGRHLPLSMLGSEPGRGPREIRLPSRLLRVAVAVAATALLAGCGSEAASSPAGQLSAARGKPVPVAAEPTLTVMVGQVMYAPVPFEGEDGATHLVYELSLTNVTRFTVSATSLVVHDADSGAAVLTLAGDALAGRTKMPGLNTYSAAVDPSAAATVFLHVTLPPKAKLPTRLTHELSVRFTVPQDGDRPPKVVDQTITMATTPVDKRVLPVLGPPLKGSGYIAADGCCDAVRHTRALLPLNGAPLLAQRYAIDYEQLNADNRIYVGPREDNMSYVIYGAEALAVANATVVGTVDGLPDLVPGTPLGGGPLSEVDGNYVVLDLGQGFYANYAHLQPGSVRVEPGDHVKKGDVLGLVGNSGNSLAPHLHFHVMDTASPIVSQGLPYLMDRFTVTARAASTEAFDRAEVTGEPLQLAPGVQPSDHKRQLILDQSIATFGR